MSTTSQASAASPIKEFAYLLRRGWPIILACLLPGAFLAKTYIDRIPREYAAETVILVDPRQHKVTTGPEVVEQIKPTADVLGSEIELIKSPLILKPVAAALGLATANDSAGLDKAAAALGRQVEVELRRNSYLVVVRVTANDAEGAQKAANLLSEEFLQYQARRRLDANKQATGMLTERIAALSEPLRKSEAAVERFRIENNSLQAIGQPIGEQQLVKINDLVSANQAKVAEATARYEEMLAVTRGSGRTAGRLADVAQSEGLTGIRTQLLDATKREAELSARYRGEFPGLVRVRAEISGLNKSLTLEVNKAVSRLRLDVEVAKSQLDKSIAEQAAVSAQVAQSREKSVKLRELEREAAANKAIYEGFLARAREVAEQSTFVWPEYRILRAATVPTTPSHPPRARYYAMSLLGLSALGLGLAMLLDRMRTSVTTPRQLSQLAGGSGVVALPCVTRRELKATGALANASAYVINRPLSDYSNGLREARLELDLDNRTAAGARVVLVTGCDAGDVETLVAHGMAAIGTSKGDRVLLIDAALSGRPSAALSGDQPDLIEALRGNGDWSDAVRHDAANAMDVLRARAPDPAAVELLGGAKMQTLLDEARGRYDLIVIGCPPVLESIEARTLLTKADKHVVVSRWRRTPATTVRKAVDVITQRVGKPALMIMTDTNFGRLKSLYGVEAN